MVSQQTSLTEMDGCANLFPTKPLFHRILSNWSHTLTMQTQGVYERKKGYNLKELKRRSIKPGFHGMFSTYVFTALKENIQKKKKTNWYHQHVLILHFLKSSLKLCKHYKTNDGKFCNHIMCFTISLEHKTTYAHFHMFLFSTWGKRIVETRL